MIVLYKKTDQDYKKKVNSMEVINYLLYFTVYNNDKFLKVIKFSL